jgi:hypothetical protein
VRRQVQVLEFIQLSEYHVRLETERVAQVVEDVGLTQKGRHRRVAAVVEQPAVVFDEGTQRMQRHWLAFRVVRRESGGAHLCGEERDDVVIGDADTHVKWTAGLSREERDGEAALLGGRAGEADALRGVGHVEGGAAPPRRDGTAPQVE